ncbi:unnamed protein product [Gadus morhua 'NCC']
MFGVFISVPGRPESSPSELVQADGAGGGGLSGEQMDLGPEREPLKGRQDSTASRRAGSQSVHQQSTDWSNSRVWRTGVGPPNTQHLCERMPVMQLHHSPSSLHLHVALPYHSQLEKPPH